jgi:hypothetical protein
MRVTAQTLLAQQRDSWGEDRTQFFVTSNEMSVLLRDAKTVCVERNRPNGDGTFYTKVTYQGYTFETSNVTTL